MGRQINFYMGEKIKHDFVDFLIYNEYTFVHDGNCDSIQYVEINEIENNRFLCLYKPTYGEIKLRNIPKTSIYYIEKNYNPIIEFMIPKIKKEKIVLGGRLWLTSYDFQDSNADRTIISNDYNNLVKWIKNRIPYRKVDGYSLKMYIDDEILELINKGYKLK